MPAMKSNLFLLKIGNGATSNEVFTTVAALTNVQLTFNKGNVDVTTKDAAAWAQSLEGGGQRSVQIQANGMLQMTDATQASLKAAALATTNTNFQISDEKLNVWQGRFAITQYEEDGAVNGVHTFKITMMSDGATTYTPKV
ncbi:MAG: hypothetical protein EOO38_11900 [Cytophagaceae bacterium]|nr:MAG: hypothetical protein EOO38_11900 [Cytophagaceae bacterium]